MFSIPCVRRFLAVALLLGLIPSQVAAQQAIQVTPQNLTTKNLSATIATGNTFQQVLAAAAQSTVNQQPARRSLTIQNNNMTDACWIAFGMHDFGSGPVAITAGNATTAISIELTAGGSYQRYEPFVPSDAIIGTCASSSDTLYIDVQ